MKEQLENLIEDSTHTCRYCGVITDTPDEMCYKAPKNLSENSFPKSFKAVKLKFYLRVLAVFDVLFSEKFELTTWNKKGRQTSKTKFCKTDINNLK